MRALHVEVVVAVVEIEEAAVVSQVVVRVVAKVVRVLAEREISEAVAKEVTSQGAMEILVLQGKQTREGEGKGTRRERAGELHEPVMNGLQSQKVENLRMQAAPVGPYN
mmetsp:Transcript_7762/g.13791  ORF Transcript_7762/g.13791 Transcript_7762/m.13791 type:complete len:109 (-) Transcript_7762:1964-2290(-)